MSRDASLHLARFVAIMLPVALLGGALASQYIGGLFPCEMCMWQRWAHIAGIAAALVAIALRRTTPFSVMFTLLAALGIAISGAIGAFHAGVEYRWWAGPQACSGTIPTGLSPEELKKILFSAKMVRCDEPAWKLAGISMAGWNAILSALLAIVLGSGVSRLARTST